MSLRRPRSAETTTLIGAALESERARRKQTQVEAAAEVGAKQVTWSAWARGTNLPERVDPRKLATFLHHDDGTAWSVEEVLDVLERDRAARS